MKDIIFLMEKGIQVGMCDVPDMWILRDALKHQKKKKKDISKNGDPVLLIEWDSAHTGITVASLVNTITSSFYWKKSFPLS